MKRWTPRERTLLRELYNKVRVVELGERLGRSAKSVQASAKRIGLCKSQHRWTEEELAVLRHWGTGPRKVLARQLGLEYGRVASMIAILRAREKRLRQARDSDGNDAAVSPPPQLS